MQKRPKILFFAQYYKILIMILCKVFSEYSKLLKIRAFFEGFLRVKLCEWFLGVLFELYYGILIDMLCKVFLEAKIYWK